MPRVKQRTQRLREHVLKVAVKMLESDGVSGFTARRIAQQAHTSMPAVYELFGDKAGLVRELFFEGFRLLRSQLDEAVASEDPRTDLLHTLEAFRAFMRDNPVLADVMFSRPFADFDPGPEDLKAGSAVREFIVGRVRRCLEARVLLGEEVDIAHVLVALAQGLAAQESAGWLGSSKASIDRRWKLALSATLAGLGAKTEQTPRHQREQKPS
jgi:AcrR family transcriptional regulator